MFGDASPSSSLSAGFANKVAIPRPLNVSLNLLAGPVASSTGLDSVTILFLIFEKLPHCVL